MVTEGSAAADGSIKRTVNDMCDPVDHGPDPRGCLAVDCRSDRALVGEDHEHVAGVMKVAEPIDGGGGPKLIVAQ